LSEIETTAAALQEVAYFFGFTRRHSENCARRRELVGYWL
jgi:hypothetical protein